MCLCKEANMCRYTWLPEMGLHVCTQTHMGFGSITNCTSPQSPSFHPLCPSP